MKNFWKALGLAAIAAAVVPVKVEKDEESGKKKFQSLLLSLDVERSAADEKLDVGVNLGEGILSGIIASAVSKKEGVLFADDDPESAVVGDVIDFTQAAKAHADPEGEAADESDFAEEDGTAAIPTPAGAAMVEDDEDDAEAPAGLDLDEDDFDPES